MFDFLRTFRNSRTKCPHIQQLLNHKTIKRLRPWFLCVSTFPEIEEYKISVPWTFNKEIKKLPFCHQKWGVDLYTGSTYTRVNTVSFMLLKCCSGSFLEIICFITEHVFLKSELTESSLLWKNFFLASLMRKLYLLRYLLYLNLLGAIGFNWNCL